jgi:hypothetical protein
MPVLNIDDQRICVLAHATGLMFKDGFRTLTGKEYLWASILHRRWAVEHGFMSEIVCGPNAQEAVDSKARLEKLWLGRMKRRTEQAGKVFTLQSGELPFDWE